MRIAQLTTSTTSLAIPIPTVAIVADVSRPKDAIEQPQRDPVWRVFSIGRSIVEQPSSYGACLCSLPGFHDGLSTPIGSNVVPEERRSSSGIAESFVNKVGPILVHPVVHSNRLILVA
jgi:hypothetical protein